MQVRGVWVVAALLAATTPPRAASQASPQRPTYPATRRDSVVDTLFGTPVPDPYRWLEQPASPATRDWVSAQRRVTAGYLDHLTPPARESIRRRLTALWNFPRTDVPWREAGRIFFTENSGLLRQPVLYEQRAVGETPRQVLDPQVLSPDGSIEIGSYAVSPDGRWLSYAMSPGGADPATHVRDLRTGRDQSGVTEHTQSSACWTFDGRGYFYGYRPPPPPGVSPDQAQLEKQARYHLLGEPQERDRVIARWPDVRWVYCMLSDDGRRAIIVAQKGDADVVYIMDLGDSRRPDVSRPLVSLSGGSPAHSTPLGTVGDTLYVFTDLDAPRGRVVAYDLTDGERAEPRSIVPETTLVIQGATVAGDLLAVHYLEDVKSRLRLFRLDGQGAGEVRLPGIGAVGWTLNGRNAAPELWFSFESFLTPATIYRYDLGQRASAPFRPARVPLDTSAYETRQIFFTSRDGTRVPLFLTARKQLRLDGTNPVLLTGYGGYGTINGPSYRPDLPWWLEHGGIYILANLRGGGEYGEDWHRAGSLERKQNSFDDFIGAAEFLIARRYTTPDRLAIYGHSNGGLLIGAVMTQRPDLFAVALPNAGHYDMLRYHRFTVGAGWIPEYGSPDDSAAFRYLFAYSPLQRVRPGTCYPATLLLAADHDETVVPAHAYKFTAALQAAQHCGRPILLRVAEHASHTYASQAEAIAELTDLWAFTASQLHVDLTAR